MICIGVHILEMCEKLHTTSHEPSYNIHCILDAGMYKLETRFLFSEIRMRWSSENQTHADKTARNGVTQVLFLDLPPLVNLKHRNLSCNFASSKLQNKEATGVKEMS